MSGLRRQLKFARLGGEGPVVASGYPLVGRTSAAQAGVGLCRDSDYLFAYHLAYLQVGLPASSAQLGLGGGDGHASRMSSPASSEVSGPVLLRSAFSPGPQQRSRAVRLLPAGQQACLLTWLRAFLSDLSVDHLFGDHSRSCRSNPSGDEPCGVVLLTGSARLGDRRDLVIRARTVACKQAYLLTCKLVRSGESTLVRGSAVVRVVGPGQIVAVAAAYGPCAIGELPDPAMLCTFLCLGRCRHLENRTSCVHLLDPP